MKASPNVRSFNAGEFSDLMGGRVDIDRYPSSAKSMFNFIAAPQGPAIGRSGTTYVQTAARNAEFSRLMPFVFSAEEARVLEFGSSRIRFFSEDGGLQIYTPVTATVISAAGAPIQFTSATLGASVGEDVVLAGFPAALNLNGECSRITAKAGNDYTIETVWPTGTTVVNGQAARVYSVPCTYTLAQRQAMRVLQSVDVMYIMTGTRVRKLSRFDNYDWRLQEVEFVDGPFMPINETATSLTPSATGNACAVLASNAGGANKASASSERPLVAGTRPSPVDFLERQITYNLSAAPAWLAFDNDLETYWASNVAQEGTLEYEPATPFAADGYTIYVARDNQDPTFTAKDYAPSRFTFEGWTGAAWVELDRQDEYVLYEGNKSIFIEIANTTVYNKYRLVVTRLFRNGLIEPRIARLTIREGAKAITLTASAVTGINNDQGFLATDVGRLVRIKGDDGAWRSCKITARNSATSVTVNLLAEPLTSTKPIKQWRLGYWSDTTGWPTCAEFFGDRLYFGGSTAFPDLVAGSVVGAYEVFSQTDSQGVVLDDSALAFRLNSRRLSKIEWISADDKGMLIGTGSEEYTLKASDGGALTARNPKATPATRRGSAPVEPVRIDNQLLYVQRGGRALREFAFVFESDGYKSPSMSQLASHLGAFPFIELAYAQEPHSIVWALRSNGTLVGLTYNRDESVVGWHRHDFAGGFVESIAVIPQSDGLQDALWMVIRRTINGVTKRYIERLTRFWDFNTELEDAQFVDCALRYSGTATAIIAGLQHLEGQTVYGLADLKPVGPLVVTGGTITLPFPAAEVVAGLGCEAYVDVPRLEAGAADGTAQGKTKRVNTIVAHVWRSYGGEIGVWNKEANVFITDPLPYENDLSQFDEVSLFTGLVGPMTPTPGYDLDGIIRFVRPMASPLPLNVVAVLPQLTTQDR